LGEYIKKKSPRWSIKQPWRKMAVVEASESKELQEFIGFEEYYEGQPPCFAKTWTDEDLVSLNALTAKQGLADIMERVVVGGRNAIKFKGPEAAEYLALHEDSIRGGAEFRQSDFYKKMKTDQETYEAKVRAGLFTVQELAPEYFTAEELDPINAPKMCDLFTAEELEPLKNFTIAGFTDPLRPLLKEGARRMGCSKPNANWLEDALGPRMCDLFTAEELEEYPRWSCLRRDNPQYEADRDKLLKLYEEGARRASVWLVDRKAKTLQLGE
jgi:hypothetical protein